MQNETTGLFTLSTEHRAPRTARLFISVSLLIAAPAAFAEVVVDPFNEGNTAITYFSGIGVDEDDGPGFGDLLINDGDQFFFSSAINSFDIGLPTPASRGRVFLEGAGTLGHADGGLAIAGDGSVLSITSGASVDAPYGVSMTDSVSGGAVARLIVSGRNSVLSSRAGDVFDAGRLRVDSGEGEARVLVQDGGYIRLYGNNQGEFFPTSLSLGDINADFEISGAGSTFETDHQLHLRSGNGESARVLNGGRILQTEDIGDTLERPIAFSYAGTASEGSELLVSGFGSRIDLVNDALFESGSVTLSDGASLTTQGSVFVESPSAGATHMVIDDARIVASKTVIDNGTQVTARNGSLISGAVELNGGKLKATSAGLTIAGDLHVNSGTLSLAVGQTPALAVEGTALFGPNSFIRLLLSAVPSGEILVNDYLLADTIEFVPQFSLAAQLDVQFSDDVDLQGGAEFSVRFAGLNQSVAYRYVNASKVPEIDGAGMPLAFGLLTLLFALRRERNPRELTRRSRLAPSNLAA